MMIPITRYGLPQVVVLPVAVLAAGGLALVLWPGGAPWVQLGSVILSVGMVLFFRDPERTVPADDQVLLAPADGKVTDICEVSEDEFIEGPALRIGIFLSVFDVHINRSPCAGKVAYVQAHPGKCVNAMRWRDASAVNQAHSMGLETDGQFGGKLLVKQITGAIARRIVCKCQVGDRLAAGERFGMIKLGSRTELFLPRDARAEVVVKEGQTVRAGVTVLVRYGVPVEPQVDMTAKAEA